MLLDEIKVKLEIIEENIYEFEDTEIQIIKYETQRKWRKLKSIKNLWNKFMWPNMYVQLKYQKKKKRKERRNYTQRKFEDIEENGIHIEKKLKSCVQLLENMPKVGKYILLPSFFSFCLARRQMWGFDLE